MGAAEEAYAAAVAEIARVRAEGGTELYFDDDPFRALDRIPPEIVGVEGLVRINLAFTRVIDLAPLAGLTALQRLELDYTPIAELTPLAGLTALQLLGLDCTQVADISPLAGLTSLQWLGLINTQVADLAPLAGLTMLHGLRLDNTEVADLSPLARLSGLRELWLGNTKVTDLRLIRNLRGLEDGQSASLDFTNTPFANATAETRRLAAIEDHRQRTVETLAFLKTLPPWPEPLPWEVPAEPEPEPPPPEPDFPVTLEAVLTAQSPLGWRFSPEHGAMVIHMEVCEVTALQAQLARMSRDKVGELLRRLPNDPSGLRGQARTEAQRFADLLDDQSRDLSRRSLELWGSLIQLGAILDENTVARADGRHPLDLLRAEERAALVTLLAIAGNLVRSFPDAQALDDSAGAFLRRAVTQETVAAMIEAALRRAFVEARSAALIQHVAQVGQGEGVQAQKAGAVTVRGAANLIRAAAVVIMAGGAVVVGGVADGALNKVGSDLADHYELSRRAIDFIEDLRGQTAPLIEALPTDEAAELRAALEDAEGMIDRLREGPR